MEVRNPEWAVVNHVHAWVPVTDHHAVHVFY